jgi:subtilisin family serine protease
MASRRPTWLWLPLLLLSWLAPLAVQAQPSPRLDRQLQEALSEGRDARAVVKAHPGERAQLLVRLANLGVAVEAEHALIDAVTVPLSSAQMAMVCVDSVSAGCSADAVVVATADPVAASPERRAAAAVAAPHLRRAGGDGVTVAVIDSGLHPSVAFWGRILLFADFTHPDGLRFGRPFDDYGQGTHVAGLIGAQQASTDVAMQGLAPAVTFVGLKVLDADGRGRTSAVIRALEFAVANRQRYGIDVVNLALGHPVLEPSVDDPLVQAVEQAVRAGIAVVVSAGSGAPSDELADTSPGHAPSALGVRVSRDGQPGARWSEVAPDSTLVRRFPELVRLGPSGRAFLELSGPSTATAVTTGLVALAMSGHGGQR